MAEKVEKDTLVFSQILQFLAIFADFLYQVYFITYFHALKI